MATQKRFIAKNGLDNNSLTIQNVADPVNAQDAATRAYVLANASSSGVSSVNTRTGAVTLTSADVGLGNVTNNAAVANLSGTNTGDQVIPVASSTTPAALGSAAVGTGTTFARADHVHASPTTITGNAGTATSIAAGVAGSIPYQSAASTTAMTAASTVAGQVLTTVTAGGAPTWVSPTVGTVTSVTGTAPVVSSGGTTPAISMAAATASVNGYMTSTYATKLDGISAGATANTGTVTSVAALTLGTTGTDVSSTVATGTTTPVITLNIPTASATNRGALSSTDWGIFNGKQAAGAYLTSAVTSVGGTGTVSGLTLTGTVTSTGSLTLGGTLALGSLNTLGTAAGLSATLIVGSGGTGVTTLTGIPYGNATSAFTVATAAQLVTAIGASTTLVAGSMSSADKTKLDAITGTNTGNETGTTIRTALGITTLSGSNTGDQTSVSGSAGSCTGNAATATLATNISSPDGDRLSSTKLPTTNPKQVRFDFVGGAQVGSPGSSYAGLMTYAPWTGDTASTGDASYQLAFAGSGANGTGVPVLKIRKGIDSTWNSWYDVVTSASGTATIATSLAAGVAGSVPYQTAASTTAMTAASTVAGQVLTTVTAGGAPTWQAPAGSSGLFNPFMSASVGYLVTTSLAAAFTAPATAGLRYIVHSIHVTNIGTVADTITAEISGTTYSGGISLSNTIPIPVAGSVELLKKPKVMQPSDILNMISTQASTLHTTIAYEISSSSTYFGVGVNITTDATYTDLYTMTGNSVLESIFLVNDSLDSDAKVTLVWTDGANAIQGYFAYNFIVALNSTIEILEKPKYIASGYKLRVQSNVGNRVEAIVAGKTL